MKTRIIYPVRTWYDKQFSKLTPTSKLLCLYLLTNENIGLCPIYRQPDLQICFLLNLTGDQLEACKIELEAAGLFNFYQEWVEVRNNFSYNDYFGRDRLMDSKEKELSDIPADVATYFKGLSTGYKPVTNPLLKSKYKIEGGMGETKLSDPTYLTNLPSNDLDELSQQFKLQTQTVLQKAAELHDWYLGNPQKNRKSNWKATLRNALRKDADDLRKKEPPVRVDHPDVTEIYPDITDEMRSKNIEKIAEMREKLFGKS